MNNDTVQQDARTPDFNTAFVRSEERVAYKDLPMDRLADEIEKISVDGRPAHPEMGPRRIRRLIMALFGVILVTGVLVALLVDRAMGLGIAAFGSVLLIVNPELWATVFRARERRRAQRQLERTRPTRRTKRRANGQASQAPHPLAGSSTDVPTVRRPAGLMRSGENTIDAFSRWNA